MKLKLHYTKELFYILTFFMFLFGGIINVSAASYNSIKDGNWNDPSIWSGSVVPSTEDNVTINSKVTLPMGLTYSINNVNVNGSLTVNGNLTIGGNLSMSNDSLFNMGSSAVVIVKGDVTMANKANISLGSYFIVLGNFSSNGSSNQGSFSINSAHVYILGTVATPYSNISHCPDYNGTTTNSNAGCDYGSYQALITNETGTANSIVADLVQDLINNPIYTEQKTNLTPPTTSFCVGSSTLLTISETGTVSEIRWFKDKTLVSNIKNPSKPSTYSANQEGTYYAMYAIGGKWYKTNNAIVTGMTLVKPGAITGLVTQCSGAITQIYSIAAVPNASSYAWTVPGGWSITKGLDTNAIEVTVGTGSGNISVNVVNACGIGYASGEGNGYKWVNVNSTPALIYPPNTTNADNIQCDYAMLNWNQAPNATGFYLDIATDANFTNYVDIYHDFHVNYNNGSSPVYKLPSGDLYYRVRAYNSCATTGYSNTGTFRTTAPLGGSVSPAQTICSGSSPTTNLTLSGYATANTKILKWQKASDASFTTNVSDIDETTNILTVSKMGAITANTYFRAEVQNQFGSWCISYSSPVLITVNNGGSGGAAPGTPGAITGSATQCSGAITQIYSIVAVANATIYNWTVPAGWSITNGQGTNEIKVTVGAAGQNGNISVSAGNGCSVSQNKTLAVTVGSCINKWKGSISNNWNTPANWTQNFVPAVDASIVFDDAPVNHLVLDQNRSVTNITNAQSIYRLVCNGFKLSQKGNTLFTNGAQIDASTAGSVMEFAGAAAQSIPAGSFVNDAVFNLTVNNVNNVTVNGNLRILNLLNVSVGRLDAFSNSPTIIYGGFSAQTIESNQYLNEKIFNLNIDNTNGVTLNTNFALDNNLTINSAKKFIIDAAKSLTVTGTIANSAATSGFVLKSTAAGTASLIHNTNNVPATVQRYISGASEDWHFLSSPVSNQTIVGSSLTPSGTYGNGTGYDLYLWNEPTPCWVYHKNDEGGLTIDPKNPKWPAVHSSTKFIPGCGYLYSVQATNPTTEFAGNLNNGSIIYSITNSINGEDPKVRGFNLIGNPYPSTIDWKATSGWTRDALVVSGDGYDMWIWNPVTNNYGVFNSGTAIGTNGVTQNIAPMQGFFVRAATNGNIGMTNSVRGTAGTSNWMRMKTTTAEIVKVQITSNDNYGSDEILLQFGAPANEAGAPKLFSTVTTAPSLFLNREKKELSVLNLTNVIENSSVPLMFKAGKDGNYALSIGNESASYEVLLLEDKKAKTITDLNLIPTYQFKGSVKDAADRFILHFVPITPEVTNLPAVIYYDGDEINVDLILVEGQTDIKIYDMSGKLLVDKKVEGKMIHSFNINPQYEIYIVVVNSNGHSTRRKVLTY